MTKAFIIGEWHAWQGTQYMLSHEPTKTLRAFETTDDCINWLYLNNERDVARKLHAALKHKPATTTKPGFDGRKS